MQNFLNTSNITGQKAKGPGLTGYQVGTHVLFWMPQLEASNSENTYSQRMLARNAFFLC